MHCTANHYFIDLTIYSKLFVLLILWCTSIILRSLRFIFEMPENKVGLSFVWLINTSKEASELLCSWCEHIKATSFSFTDGSYIGSKTLKLLLIWKHGQWSQLQYFNSLHWKSSTPRCCFALLWTVLVLYPLQQAPTAGSTKNTLPPYPGLRYSTRSPAASGTLWVASCLSIQSSLSLRTTTCL